MDRFSGPNVTDKVARKPNELTSSVVTSVSGRTAALHLDTEDGVGPQGVKQPVCSA